MTKYNGIARTSSAAAFVIAFALAGINPAVAAEITGHGKSLKNPDGTLNGNSLCAYSGRNDTPNGFSVTLPNGVVLVVDPGGDVQSFGYFMSQFDFTGDPSDPDTRDSRGFPGFDCNPNSGSGH